MRHNFSILKENFQLNSNYMRYALRLMLACTLVAVLYQLLHLKNGYWAGFSVIACVWPTQGISIKRTYQRLLGTLIGMFIGIVVAHSIGRHILYIDIALPIIIFLTFYLRAYAYSLYVLFTTVVTILLICLVVPGDWQVAITRLVMTTLGALVGILFTLFVLPSYASKTLQQQFIHAKKSLCAYFNAVVQIITNKQNHNLQPLQFASFQSLQTVLLSIEESSFEFKETNDQFSDKNSHYQSLEKIYQDLLVLETYMIAEVENQTLTLIHKNTVTLMKKMLPLFMNTDLKLKNSLLKQVESLFIDVRQQRSMALKNIDIPSVTFYEHIKLSLFIKSLRNLLTDL